MPLLSAEALARWDYHRTREVRARAIIDALDRYAIEEDLYPDELEQLVAAGQLASLPRPAIGFRFLDDRGFRYQSFGTSFILEFVAPRWVECAYTPPFDDEEELETGDAPGAGERHLDESWSCPSSPPELW